MVLLTRRGPVPWFAEDMTTQEQRSLPSPVVGGLGLLGLGIVLLGVGGFVRFHDNSGTGSDRWILPLGVLAALVAAGGVGVAFVSTQSRRWVGGALVLLDVVLVWQSASNSGFRFVWMADEGELILLEVAIGLIALLLLALSLQLPRPAASAGGLQWPARAALYLSGVVAAVIVGFFVGVRLYEAEYCGRPEGCDADDLTGLGWGVTGSLIALAVGVVVILVTEVVRRQQRKVGTPA
ncbi:hypothetical protein GCM10022235_03110 [Kribbella ginsengisoli]|uniref:Disulfide bond formation protein B n=2 Tax=Kribbella ginsengisoli TaxID=363865 RepID=A0ABP6VSI3_9ACTN